MYKLLGCTIPDGTDRQSNKRNNQFIQMIMEENRRVKAMPSQELAENPLVREKKEITDISEELRTLKHDQIVEEKRRQQLRENSQELRQLKLQLRAAVVAKQLAEQRDYLDKEKEAALRTKRKENADYEADRLTADKEKREREAQERLKKEKHRIILRGQMAEGQQRKMEEYQEIMKDRENMQKLLQRLKDERIVELKALEERKVMTKHQMEEFVRMQKLYQMQQHAQKVDEFEKFQELMLQRDEIKRKAEEEKRRERADKQALSERIGRNLFMIESEKRRREELLLDLLVEERKAKEDLRFRQNLEKQLQERIQVRQELETYNQDTKGEKEVQMNEEIERYRAQEKHNLAQLEKLDKIAAERRHKKVVDHGRAIQEMIMEKRHQKAIDIAEKLKEDEFYLREEKRKEQEIEDERLRMLSKHPADVLRYLPAGVLRDSDREVLALPSVKKN